MAFIPYSQMGPDQRAVKIMRQAQSKIPAKRRMAIRVLSNAIRHITGEEIHPDNRSSVAAVWRSLARRKGTTKRVWEIADSLIVKGVRTTGMAGGKMSPRDILPARADVIETCVKSGINPATASTQYGRWKKARGI